MKTAFIQKEDLHGFDMFELIDFLEVEHGFNPRRKVIVTRFSHGIMFEQEER